MPVLRQFYTTTLSRWCLFPQKYSKIVVAGQCKHYFKLISQKDQNAYQLSADMMNSASQIALHSAACQASKAMVDKAIMDAKTEVIVMDYHNKITPIVEMILYEIGEIQNAQLVIAARLREANLLQVSELKNEEVKLFEKSMQLYAKKMDVMVQRYFVRISQEKMGYK